MEKFAVMGGLKTGSLASTKWMGLPWRPQSGSHHYKLSVHNHRSKLYLNQPGAPLCEDSKYYLFTQDSLLCFIIPTQRNELKLSDH